MGALFVPFSDLKVGLVILKVFSFKVSTVEAFTAPWQEINVLFRMGTSLG